VKWPNDVLVRGRKIAGILCETVRRGYLLGIGLNCNQTRFPLELKGRATSVRMETCSAVDPLALLAPVLQEIHRFVRGSALPYLQPLLWGLGEEVAVRSQAATVFGRIAGVDGDGALILAAASAERRMISGEIVRFR
jgi:BirA family biotin operon repressor/biotin-[acetyl-CoA-carboxylase] ligase